MNTERPPDDQLLRRYLLGDRLAETEEDRIEQHYFADDKYLEHLTEIEDDLIDAYIRGGLSEGERAGFERHFLAAARRRERYEALRALAAGFFRARPRPRPSFLKGLGELIRAQSAGVRMAMGMAGAAAAAAVAVLGTGYIQQRNDARAARTELLAMRREVPEARPVQLFTLQSGLLRSVGGNEVRVTAGTQFVVLRLALPEGRAFPRFAVTVSTTDGEELLSQRGLAQNDAGVELAIPAGVLKRGESYVVSIAGIALEGAQTSLPSYVFHMGK